MVGCLIMLIILVHIAAVARVIGAMIVGDIMKLFKDF